MEFNHVDASIEAYFQEIVDALPGNYWAFLDIQKAKEAGWYGATINEILGDRKPPELYVKGMFMFGWDRRRQLMEHMGLNPKLASRTEQCVMLVFQDKARYTQFVLTFRDCLAEWRRV